MADEYLRIIAMGLVFGSVGSAANMLLRGEGKIKEAMLIMAGGTILNIILDPVLIGLLHMQVAGVAVATVVSQSVICIITISYLFSKNSTIPFIYIEGNGNCNCHVDDFNDIW